MKDAMLEALEEIENGMCRIKEQRSIWQNSLIYALCQAVRLLLIDKIKEKQTDCFVKEMQTVDAVPVIRCLECKQGEIDDPDFPDEYYCHEGCGWNKGDFYCAYGELKEGAD